MRHGAKIGVLVPALDEELAIAAVIEAMPAWIDEIVVVDNGSRDATAVLARAAGARVIRELRRGYGAACLAGIGSLPQVDIVVFVEADASNDLALLADLIDPIGCGEADLVIAQRTPSSLMGWHQRFGNRLACGLIHWFWGVRYEDLGPLRAIRCGSLSALEMCDRDYGWTVEMQIKAILHGLRIAQVHTRALPRIGQSKISGSLVGSVRAGAKILWTILWMAWRYAPDNPPGKIAAMFGRARPEISPGFRD